MSDNEDLVKDDKKFDTEEVESVERCAQIELTVNKSTEHISAGRGKRVLCLGTIFDSCNYPAGTRSGDPNHCYEYSVTRATWRVHLNQCSISVSDIIGAYDLPKTHTETHSTGQTKQYSGEGQLEVGVSTKDGLSGKAGGKANVATTDENSIETNITVPHYRLHPALENQLNLIIGTGKTPLSGKFIRDLAIVWNWTQTSSIEYQGNFIESDVKITHDSTTYLTKLFRAKQFAAKKTLLRGVLDDLNRKYKSTTK